MASLAEIAAAVAIIREVAGNPETGAVKDLIDLLNASAITPIEVRIVEPKEKR